MNAGRERTNFDRYLERKLQNPEFRERFEEADRSWDTALQLAALRKKRGLTQKEVADRYPYSLARADRIRVEQNA